MKTLHLNFWIFFGLLMLGCGNLFAQSATVTVKTETNNELMELNCYWIEDNFEFFNFTPLQKNKASRKGDSFTIDFDSTMSYRYITIKDEKGRNSKNLLLFDYLICPGDQIIVWDDGINDLTFSGRGSEKFKLQYQLSKIEKAFFLDKSLNDTNYLPNQGKLSTDVYNILTSNLSYNYAKRDSQLYALDLYKGLLSQSVYDLIKLNVIGKTEQTILKHLYMKFYRLSHKYMKLSEEKSSLLEIYSRRNTRLNEVTENVIIHANELQLYSMSRMKYKDWLGKLYEQEFVHFPIDIPFADRVLYRYFYRNYSKINSVKHKEILSQISEIKYKTTIQNFLKNIEYGAVIPNFQLQDTSGNLIHLSNFYGKIIILDFWYTGCGNCRVLHENMKPIKAELQNIKDLIFINVSIDGNFEQWRQSVNNGDYTDKSDISLYTMGKKSLHPLITFFNVMSYPRQVIIDREMRIVETQVPRVGNTINDAAFKALIEKLR